LTDPKRARAEAQAEAKHVRARILVEIRAELGLTPADVAIFTTLHYGYTVSPSDMPAAAFSEARGAGDPVTEEECQAALASCLAKGLLQVIDDLTLAKIVGELRDGGILGPIYHLPWVGGVDFTPAGAELWHRLGERYWSEHRQPPFAYCGVVHSKTAQYYKTRTAALAAIAQVRDWCDVVSVIGPTPIGPWRAQWWRRFPEGYRIDIEERSEWQGRCGGSRGRVIVPSLRKFDPKRLQQVLDRHNVTFGEWLLLSAMDWSDANWASGLPKCVVTFVERAFGVTVSEEDCRTGLENCLRYGWLRAVDELHWAEVRALLRDDPALLPLDRRVAGAKREIHFTLCGAVLYRMIAAEWLGPDWEDDLYVEKEYYRKEHRYCETEEGLQGIVPGYAAQGEVVRSSKIVPIGPWCVYWWERFPSGYRMELEIGEP
jgi:hypothetical protein